MFYKNVNDSYSHFKHDQRQNRHSPYCKFVLSDVSLNEVNKDKSIERIEMAKYRLEKLENYFEQSTEGDEKGRNVNKVRKKRQSSDFSHAKKMTKENYELVINLKEKLRLHEFKKSNGKNNFIYKNYMDFVPSSRNSIMSLLGALEPKNKKLKFNKYSSKLFKTTGLSIISDEHKEGSYLDVSKNGINLPSIINMTGPTKLNKLVVKPNEKIKWIRDQSAYKKEKVDAKIGLSYRTNFNLPLSDLKPIIKEKPSTLRTNNTNRSSCDNPNFILKNIYKALSSEEMKALIILNSNKRISETFRRKTSKQA